MSFLEILPHLLLPISIPSSLTLPPFPHRGIISTIAISALAYLTLTSPFPSETNVRYGLSQAWFWYIPAFARLLIPYSDSEGSFHRVPGFQKTAEHAYWHNGHPDEAINMGFGWRKFWWAVTLFCNPRGVGWNFEGEKVKRYRATQRTIGRGRFLILRALDTLLFYLWTDIVLFYLSSLGFPEALMSLSMMERIKVAAACTTMIGGNWMFQWNIASFIGVGLGLSAPEDWPPFFGSLSQVTSIAYFWGSFWQQILHETVLTYSRWLVTIFLVPRHSAVAYFTHLSTAFFISGGFHFLTLAPLSAYPQQREKFVQIMFFFMMQPVGILFEQWFKSNFKITSKQQESTNMESKRKSGEENIDDKAKGVMKRFLGYVWVISFLFVTGWPFLEVYLKIGMADWQVPFSIVAWLAKYTV